CASTGNTSASAAAYAANCGMEAYVLIPDGKIALGKLSQGMRYGAKVIQIRGNFDDALELVRKISADGSISLVNSVNPYRIEGQKTASFEIVDELGFAPDYHALPVGNAGNITAYWMGYKEYFDKRISKSLPKMIGFQAAGSAPNVLGHPIDNPETIATAIRIGKPASWTQAEAARDESGGVIDAVTDDEILQAYDMLASMEGVFCDPASAASVAGVIKLNKAGYFQPGATIVCTLTGNGLKDPDTAMSGVPAPVTIDATEDAVRKVLD
ncbi:MAG: threonine synthase, partial [Mariprofundaceae bacterium]|nr:threonine synthase [Mariprofundaceae bacterium]